MKVNTKSEKKSLFDQATARLKSGSCLIGTNVASLADKDGVINCAEKIQLTNMQSSEAPSRRWGASLERIFVSWICKAQLIKGLCQLVMRH